MKSRKAAVGGGVGGADDYCGSEFITAILSGIVIVRGGCKIKRCKNAPFTESALRW